MNIFAAETDYADIEAVRAKYPDAASIIEVEGGWMVFEFATDEETWLAQQ